MGTLQGELMELEQEEGTEEGPGVKPSESELSAGASSEAPVKPAIQRHRGMTVGSQKGPYRRR